MTLNFTPKNIINYKVIIDDTDFTHEVGIVRISSVWKPEAY